MVIKNEKGEIKTLKHNGIKAISFNESFFVGHFPENPVMPGVLILESMAQTAACLVSYGDLSLSENKLVFFTGIEKAKFKKPVLPGCVLCLEINLITYKKTLYKFSGKAYVENELVAFSEFSAMLVDQDKAQ
jgi:3-hydroxymyristoyl/3-hydroxydecanoyl-(acyl carrier protein) dehydratase